MTVARATNASPNRRRRGLTASLFAIALVASSCGSANPSPTSPPSAATASPSAGVASPSGGSSPASSADLGSVYQTINQQVRAIRGLDEKQPVVPTILSRDDLAKLLAKEVAEDTPPAAVAASERLYHALGVLAKDVKLSDVYSDLLESQVAGLYVPKDKKLYVLSKAGGLGPIEKVYYSHEYTHALQDQNFDLQSFQPDSLADQGDEQLARQALVEGDAYVTMTYWLQQHLSSTDMAAVVAAGNDPAAQQALAKIPPLVASQILFAALNGTVWALGLQIQGGYPAINAAFANPPQSTEQILHPEKWASREPPIEVKLPADLPAKLGAGWSFGLQDTFGEHQLGVWITAEAPSAGLPAPSPASVAGWGGDRVALLDGPDGKWAVVFRTEWDTDADAAEFETAAAARVATATGPGRVLPGEGGRVRWIVIGSDDATVGRVSNVLGLAG